MKTFRDNAGRVWTVVINVFAVKRCRALLGVDLYGLLDGGFEGLQKLLGDPVMLIDVVYVLCEDEAKARSVSDEDFGRAFSGDVIDQASNAFLEELTDFFPDARRRAVISQIFQKGHQLIDQLREMQLKQAEAFSVEAEVAKLNGSSLNSQDSLESIQTEEHIEN